MNFTPTHNPEDISTYSNFQEIKQKELDIEAEIDFDSKLLKGYVTGLYEIIKPEVEYLILDSFGPEILSVEECINNVSQSKNPLEFEIYQKNSDKEAIGTPLIIKLPEKKDKEVSIRIQYVAKNEKCLGIEFLEKEQTYSKKYPFMFTQGEPIYTRSLFPCQDTPNVKVTCKVKTIAPDPITFLFSGIQKAHYLDSNNNKIIKEYVQNVPIPTYLIAFAAGYLEYGRLNDVNSTIPCGVWTEVGLNEKARFEFSETETYVTSAEKYFKFPYQWTSYDILILPPSFPYGGMENPNLTFVTPSLLAGDKSLANVIGHEICHSWTGNLVTNKNWKNFWINEGFTDFAQRKLTKMMFGEELAKLEAKEGEDSMYRDIEMLGKEHNFTSLSPNYDGINPDDGFTTIPYEKGFAFLSFLEELVGEELFQNIIASYIKKYKFKSVDYTAFKNEYEEMVKKNLNDGENILKKIDWDAWINTPGKPLKTVDFNTNLIKEAQDLAEKFLNGKNDELNDSKEKFNSWHTSQKLVFLKYLMKNSDRIDDKVYNNIRDRLALNKETYNSEIKSIWYQIALKTKHNDVYPEMKEFLKNIGRLKFIRPIYFDWITFNKADAKEFFEKNKYLYHNMAVRLIEGKING